MSIKRYLATKDNTISSAFKANLSDRGVTSNMGSSDILEMFSIFGQASSSSLEQSRILVEFPVNDIHKDRQAGIIPASGSVKFKLKMFNAEHNQTVPEKVTVTVAPLVKAWSEGSGLDMESYLDIGASSWHSASSTQQWQTAGGDYLNSSYIASSPVPMEYTQYLDTGLENLDVDITDIVEQMIFNQAGSSTPASGSIVFNETKPPKLGAKFKIYGHDGDYRVFQFANVSSFSGNTVFVVTGSNAANSSANLINAINSSAISSSVAATGQGGNLTASLSQRAGTFYGNTIISSSVQSATASITNFAGGSGALNHGFVVKLSETQEDGSLARSYYTKKFFARTSHHGLSRPVIEVQWDSAIKDDRANVIKSSSLAPSADNLNKIYLYNQVRGNLRDIPNIIEATGTSVSPGNTIVGSHLLVQYVPSIGSAAETVTGRVLNVHSGNNTAHFETGSSTYMAARKTKTGVYYSEFAYGGTSSTLYDIWTARKVTGESFLKVSQEERGLAGNTTASVPSPHITADTTTFTGGADSGPGGFAEITLRVKSKPTHGKIIQLVTTTGDAKNFVFSNSTDVFSDTSNVDGSGRMIIGIKSVSAQYDIATRVQAAITAIGGFESETKGLDTATDVYTQLFTGSGFTVSSDSPYDNYQIPQYLTSITNLKSSYKKDEQATFRIYTRNKNWKPNLYTVASSDAPVNTIRDGFYKISRPSDNTTIIDYSTGSSPSYSSLSYDSKGSYFDLDMSILEPNYLYEISFL